jgi:hypothetical protein
MRAILSAMISWSSEPVSSSSHQLAMMAASFLTALIFKHSINNALLASSHETALAEAITASSKKAPRMSSSSTSGMIHLLLSRGLSMEVFSPMRIIYLQLAVSIINAPTASASSSSSNAAAMMHRQRIAIAGIVASHVDQLIRLKRWDAHSQHAMQTALLIDLLTGCLCAAPINNTGDEVAEGVDIHAEAMHLSLPQILRLVVDRAGREHPIVLAAVYRCIGRVAQSTGSGIRLLANASHDEVVSMLIQGFQGAVQEDQDAFRSSYLAMMATWTLLHRSEQAIAIFKRILGQELSTFINALVTRMAGYDDASDRAQTAIRVLLLS